MTAPTSTTTEDGRLIRAARALRGWSQSDLARAARVNRSTVVRLETGRPVSGAVRVAVAAVLGVDLLTAKDGAP